ncbi:hypothetical protein BS47DRAFT_1048635 [Hydnum rufescens UP504]|uniref:Uncharacterized protein n=1 Tax=Hydnum rufescens UP504 TaxID=1448309 RepID=A0A9P6AXJ5_9AGAM|nr:hypothetical protein BS47DRAFT_1048635 [Hydnum rufescens UP504]
MDQQRVHCLFLVHYHPPCSLRPTSCLSVPSLPYSVHPTHSMPAQLSHPYPSSPPIPPFLTLLHDSEWVCV